MLIFCLVRLGTCGRSSKYVTNINSITINKICVVETTHTHTLTYTHTHIHTHSHTAADDSLQHATKERIKCVRLSELF